MSVLFNHAIRYEWLEQGKNPITLVRQSAEQTSINVSANYALGRSEVAFLVMLAIGEALAFGQDLFGGIARSNVTVARIGGLYVFGSLHVPIQLRASASGIRGTFLDLSVALLTITAVGIVLLFRGADSVGARAGGGRRAGAREGGGGPAAREIGDRAEGLGSGNAELAVATP
jgi:hypothetical protein